MRFVFSDARLLAAALALPLVLGACGSKDAADNGSAVQMKGLDAVDGTINDAMTDLDGVQAEGTAMAQAADNGAAAGNASAPAKAPKDDAAADAAAEQDSEVVADQ
tara:strand:+ start:72146 stop:72463 length:318 start_codon:yes stop_codon:yes gene_type:complete